MSMDLRDYESVKFELAEILRGFVAAAPQEEALQERVRELHARLAEDRFNLLVIGRFSRGKTSLMNAILGVDRLPTGILPLTSVITSVAYGSREQVRIELRGFEYEIPMEDLAEYITECGNPGNVRGVRLAKIALPAEILRRGFYFVDTPGLGSAIAENTRTTEAFLPEADAVVMVSGYDGPLTDDELRVVRTLEASNRRLFFVLNKQDTVSPQARQEVYGYVRTRLAQVWAGELPPIFSLSAREGLAAKLAGDAAALTASGLAQFEAELTRFLIEEKGQEFLLGMCERTAQLLGACNPNAEGMALRGRLAALHAGISQGRSPSIAAMDAALVPVTQNSRAKMGECVLCARVRDALFDFLCHYQHDLAVYSEARERFAQAGGLCGAHLRFYASIAADRDICLALTPLLKRLTRLLQDPAYRALESTRAECVMCQLQKDVEMKAISELSAGEESGPPAQDRLPSVCLPHWQRIAQHLGDQTVIDALIQCQAAAVERLTEDMQRYVVKRDGLRRGLATEEETRAAQRAISFVAGPGTRLADR